MYSAIAEERRRCSAQRQDGRPCRAWACWDDEEQHCNVHAGRHHQGPMPTRFERRQDRPKAQYRPCTCEAYAWPHRPGGGLCRWPDPPRYRRMTPAGRHSRYRRGR